MDTIIFLVYENEIYVGDYYKNKLKEVKFDKADTWEVYAYEDLEKLLEYMQYPLKYNHFKNNRIIFLFDQIRVYEWMQKAESLFKQSDSLYISRVEPFIKGFEEQLEDKKVIPIYEKVLEYNWEEAEEGLRYEVVLSPATLYTTKEEKKAFLHVQDLVDKNSLIKDGSHVEKGNEILAYDHHVQKLFGRTQVERLTKKVESTGCFYWYTKEEDRIWARKDQLIGVVDRKQGSKEEMLAWCKNIL